MNNIAILYQSQLPPSKGGIQKPMKPGGYADSGADIAYELVKNGVKVITPVENPDVATDTDWVFPDTKVGIEKAIDKGAEICWLNTVLFKRHPIEKFFDHSLRFIGQLPDAVDLYDDKFFTNQLLRKNQIPVPEMEMVSAENFKDYSPDLGFPLVLKPIRGRGSQGVSLVKNLQELNDKLDEIFRSQEFGSSVYVEQYLAGQEITITVMPAGVYHIGKEHREFTKPWCLPAVKRFNHLNGIAPYNGLVAVMKNSAVLENNELQSDSMLETYRQCEKAAELVKSKAPIRIDCRADENGNYFLFDLNMKPNMTGPSRPQRKDQDSLTLLAARKIGWNYFDLLKNMIDQAWEN